MVDIPYVAYCEARVRNQNSLVLFQFNNEKLNFANKMFIISDLNQKKKGKTIYKHFLLSLNSNTEDIQ